MGDLARARELVLEGLRIDPYHGALWTVYSIIERQDGSEAKARKVFMFVLRQPPTAVASNPILRNTSTAVLGCIVLVHAMQAYFKLAFCFTLRCLYTK